MQTAELNLPNMTCESCAQKIENAVKHAGVDNIKFDFKARNMTVEFDEEKTSLNQIKSAVKNSGYEVV